LALPHGIPSADTFERVFARIDPEEFKNCFIKWIQAAIELTKDEVIAVDGKTLRRSHDKSNGISAIHMVSAWACANGLVIGQIKTEEKSNEITAIPQLLKMLEIEGCIVTIDAMGCQKNISKTIVEKNADYIFSLKGNQSNLHDDVKLLFQAQKEDDFKEMSFDYHETIDADHGRIETRKYWTTSDIGWLQGKKTGKSLKLFAWLNVKGSLKTRPSARKAITWAVSKVVLSLMPQRFEVTGQSRIVSIGYWMYHSVKMKAGYERIMPRRILPCSGILL